MRRLALFASTSALLLALLPMGPVQAAGGGESRETVIVVLHDGAGRPADVAADMERRHGGRTGFVYEHALKGFSMELPPKAFNAIARDSRVRSVEFDQVAQTASEIPTGVQRIFAPGNSNLDIDATDDYRVDVDVAVIDTGIDMDHPDLNVVGGTDCASGSRFSSSCVGTTGEDGNGHGTHVAGSVAAIDDGKGVVGVAPGARLHAVRVLDNRGSGQISWIVAGIDWVTARADEIEVANMSLGCECTSSSMNTAIANSVAAGVTYAVAAGNNDKDSSTFSPANHPDVITVSALADFNGLPGGGAASTCRADVDDTLADFSNWGASVEIAAPGVCIRSTWLKGGYNTISGTSMASPHVAGAAALLMSGLSEMAPSTVETTLVGEGNLDWTDDSGDGVQEPLLDVSDTLVFNPTMVGQTTEPTTNSPPTASFTYSCTGRTCDFDARASSDSDGTITSYSWNFGDETAATGATTSHTYAADGSYTVTLTVTDDDAATASASKSVAVSSTSGISLSVSGYKVKGVQHADLTWSGAGSATVDVYRNGQVIDTTANDGFHTDNIGTKGGGSYTYKVCEAGTTNCSNEATVSF